MRKRTYDNANKEQQRPAREQQMEVDLSLLQRPMHAAFGGFKEAKRAFENGTSEVRRLLMNECSLIYECNVCRNMFRSLANFISHKRVFCCGSSSNNSNGFADGNATVIIQTPEADDVKRSRSTGTSPVPRALGSNGDINSVIESLRSEQKSDELSPLMPQGCSTVLQLERVMPNSDQAVYQTLKCEAAESIKTEVQEVQKPLDNTETVLESDGKAIDCSLQKNGGDEHSGRSNEGDEQGQRLSAQILCDICKESFQTEKTLKLHIQKKHISSTYVFQCPTCELTFTQPAAVIRHLANEHKKPVRRIRMREAILKRRLPVGDVETKGPSRELKQLQMLEQPGDAGASASADIVGDGEDRKLKSTCPFCQKCFERKAALSTHIASCRIKHEVAEETPPMAIKRLKPLPQPIDDIPSSYGESTEASNPNQTEIKVDNTTIKQELLDSDSLNEMFANLGKQSFGSGLQTVSLDKLDILEGESTSASNTAETHTDTPTQKDSNPVKGSVDSSDVKRRFRIVHAVKHLRCRCKICNKQFNALSNLRRHISMFHYRARKFGCKLCDYRAFRRYDIVNHLGFVHKMTGEREAMSTEYVAVHEVHYSKDDVDGDIVLITDETDAPQTLSEVNRVKTYEKRCTKRVTKNKPMISSVAAASSISEGDGKPTRQRLKRSHSQQQQREGSKPPQKRPIRNRIKPVNKDFVYDLSNLMHNEQPGETGDSTMHSLKRRNTLNNGADSIPSLGDMDGAHIAPLISDRRTELIRGSARRISLLLVNQGRAASSTLPELPAERPQMRPRLTSTYRVDMQAVPVIETSELEAARLKATLLDDSFLEKIAKRSSTSFKVKPCLALPHSALSSLLEKVDSSLHLTSPAVLPLDEQLSISEINEEIPVATPNDAVTYNPIDSGSDASLGAKSPKDNHFFIEPEPSIPESSSPPPTPRKRITLMQRLAENKAKHRDSLLRTALEN